MILYIIRGLQGAGKTTHAKSLNPTVHAEADMYFVHDGVYRWDPNLIGAAHDWCLNRVRIGLMAGLARVVVSNTFIRRKDMEPYVALAAKYGYSWEIIDLFDGGLSDEELCARCVHAVPLATIQRNRARYEK